MKTRGKHIGLFQLYQSKRDHVSRVARDTHGPLVFSWCFPGMFLVFVTPVTNITHRLSWYTSGITLVFTLVVFSLGFLIQTIYT